MSNAITRILTYLHC